MLLSQRKKGYVKLASSLEIAVMKMGEELKLRRRTHFVPPTTCRSRAGCKAGLVFSYAHGVKRLGVSLDDADDPGPLDVSVG